MPVCLSRTLTFLATHSLACCDKGKQDQQTLLSPSRPNVERRDEPSRPLCAALDTPPIPAHHQRFLRTNPARPQHKEPAAHQRKRREKASRAKQVTTTHFLPTLYSFQAGDQAQVATQPTPKDPVPGSRRSGPTLASWDHLIFPHAASVGNLDPRHTDGKSHRDKGPPEAGHGHPYLSLARADTRSRSQGVTYRCLLRGRLPIASCLQVLKRRPMISQPHVIQHTLVPA